MRLISLTGSILLLFRVVSAYIFNSWVSTECTGIPGGLYSIHGPEKGCQTTGKGSVGSIKIESTGPVDSAFTTVFFASDDCDPLTEIKHADETDGCVPVKYSSFEVWNLCPNGNAGCVEW